MQRYIVYVYGVDNRTGTPGKTAPCILTGWWKLSMKAGDIGLFIVSMSGGRFWPVPTRVGNQRVARSLRTGGGNP